MQPIIGGKVNESAYFSSSLTFVDVALLRISAQVLNCLMFAR